MSVTSETADRLGPPAVPAEATRERAAAPYTNPYLAGIGLGLVLLAAFVTMGRGLGASGAFKAVAAFLANAVAPAYAHSRAYLADYLGDGTASPLQNWLLFEVVGVAVGAFVSGMLAHRVRVTVEKGRTASSGARFLMAFAGGVVTALGAALGRGCTSGQALTGGALLNLGSWAFMLSVFAGAYGLAYFVRWEWK